MKLRNYPQFQKQRVPVFCFSAFIHQLFNSLFDRNQYNFTTNTYQFYLYFIQEILQITEFGRLAGQFC
jgi:hypothetical protein